MKKVMIMLMGLWVSTAQGELVVNITQGQLEKMPIAIPRLTYEGPEGKVPFAQKMTDVIVGNLEKSGLFHQINPKAYLSFQNRQVRFSDWRLLQAKALVLGKLRIQGQSIKVSFRLYDVFFEKELEALEFETTLDNWRRIGHKVADKIYERLTGEKGYFDSRIVYVTKDKRLATMDQDGANHRYLTDGKTLVLTPRYSPDLQEITFMDYKKGIPLVYRYHLRTGKITSVGQFPGMTSSPRYTPDGKSILLSYSRNGRTSIFEYTLSSGVTKPLTGGVHIDTSPTPSPDGKQILFNSDRGGTPQLYVMNRDGSEVHRISFGGGRYFAPVWSPRGDMIAFTRLYQGRFYIGVMKSDGTGERLLSSGYMVESPSWGPNGRVILYSKQHKGGGYNTHLYTIDITGQNEQRVPTPKGGITPYWSRLLP